MRHMSKFVLAAAFFSAFVPAMGLDSNVPAFSKALPVWPKGQAEEMNTFYGFRAAFDMEKGGTALLRITGCSDYRISLNGKHVGWGPARTTKGYFRVDEIALPAKEGRNFVAIEVAGYCVKNFYHMKQPSFLQAEVVLGDKVLAATGAAGDFAAKALPRLQKVVRYSFQRTFSEAYRLDAGFDDWKCAKGDFKSLELEERPPVKYLPRRAAYADFGINGPFKPVSSAKTLYFPHREAKRVRFVDKVGDDPELSSGFTKKDLEVNWWAEMQKIVPTNRTAVAPDVAMRSVFSLGSFDSMIFDAGLNDTGFVGLRVKCLKPGTLAVKFDEILVDGEVSNTRYGCANVIAWEFTEPGLYAVESFEPYTLRYLDVIARSGSFEISAPYMRTFKNPMARKARMESSDASLIKIFEAARESFAQNSLDVFTDCPGRERAGWLCDSFFIGRSSMLYCGSLDAEHLFLENYVLPDGFENLPDGMFAMCYPSDFKNGEFIPNWAMWLVLEVEEFKKRGGDAKLVEAFRDKFVKLVDYLKTFRNADGLLEKLPNWVFVEWSRANSLVQDVNYPSNMTWAEVLDAMDRMYSMPELAEEAQRVRETVRRQSWTGEWFCDNAVRQKDGTLKLSGECTETCQYYAFYFKTATPKTHPKLWKTLVDDFGPGREMTKKHPKIWPANAFIGNYLRLECLSREGLSRQILDETRGFFLYMADLTGTLWEHTGTSASCNHGFASHVAVVYCRDVLGVKEIDYVNRTVVFAPPADVPIDFISMNIPVGDGSISAGWKRVDGAISETLSLPAGWRRLK